MKKKVVILFLLSLFLFGCTKKEEIEKFYLEDKYYEKYEIIEINSKELIELEENDESFAVFIFMNSCSSCSKFNSILESYLEENNLTFYAINVNDIEDTDICECVKYSPSIALYNNGEIVDYLDANSDEDLEFYDTKEGFSSWFTKYVKLK